MVIKMAWTIETVKRDLPDVPVRHDIHRNEIIAGQLSGRLNDYATVSWLNTETGQRISFEASWGAIAATLNDSRSVLA